MKNLLQETLTYPGDPMKNLLQETLAVLEQNHQTPADVRWIGSTDGHFALLTDAWEQFAKIADREYDSGYGSEEILKDLVIVGDNWWLERGSYDGSEWWEYKRLPQIMPDARTFDDTFAADWDNTFAERFKDST